MPTKQARVLVEGRVQGVSYRYYTVQQAKQLDVVGWVRNLPDGRVEALFEGQAEAVEQMVNWCGRGSPSAFVSDVEVEWGEPSGGFDDFRVRGY